MADGEDLSWAVEKTETVYLVEAEGKIIAIHLCI